MDVMVPGQETEQEEMPDNTCHQPASSIQPSAWFSRGSFSPLWEVNLPFAKKPHKVKRAHLVKGKEVSNPPLKPGSASSSLGGPLEEEFHSGVLRPPEQEPLTIHLLCALFLRSQGLRLED